ncbi:5-formyltetrahydrofolate cyclo-ligase [Lysobacter sp. A289]
MTTEQAADRQQLRTELRARRRAVPESERTCAAERLACNLLSLPFAPVSGHVAGYWAMDGEIALDAWQAGLPNECVYCLPVLSAGRLCFSPWRAGDPLITNRYGIPEPTVGPGQLLEADQLGLVVVPIVGFDTTGQRLGMGGGWYDRSFAFRQGSRPPPWMVGVAFDLQRVDTLEAAEWDIPMDAVCTPSHSSLHRPMNP